MVVRVCVRARAGAHVRPKTNSRPPRARRPATDDDRAQREPRTPDRESTERWCETAARASAPGAHAPGARRSRPHAGGTRARISHDDDARATRAVDNNNDIIIIIINTRPRTADHLARGSMKTAAICASSCNPQVIRTSTSRTHIAASVTRGSRATPV